MAAHVGLPTDAQAVVVPRAAAQTIGAGHGVFVAAEDAAGGFIQRVAHIGRLIGDSYMVLGGLRVGEAAVTEGSFRRRAEGLRQAPPG